MLIGGNIDFLEAKIITQKVKYQTKLIHSDSVVEQDWKRYSVCVLLVPLYRWYSFVKS